MVSIECKRYSLNKLPWILFDENLLLISMPKLQVFNVVTFIIIIFTFIILFHNIWHLREYSNPNVFRVEVREVIGSFEPEGIDLNWVCEFQINLVGFLFTSRNEFSLIRSKQLFQLMQLPISQLNIGISGVIKNLDFVIDS